MTFQTGTSGRISAQAAPDLLERLLRDSSRTFALTIPLLPEPTRHEVTVAYLLFRVADTLEDATLWTRDQKLGELQAFDALLIRPVPEAATALSERWMSQPPLAHDGYLDLLSQLPALMRSAETVSAEAWRLVAHHTGRTTRAMAEFVKLETEGVLRLRDLDDLEAYCYAVAGIVGEMLTELFVLDRPALVPAAGDLRRDAAVFGQALQLVNILKDAADDATEGRYFLPEGTPRAAVFALARRSLATARGYCARLEDARAERGIVAFTALPVLLAQATLDRVEAHGPGAKIDRAEVGEIVARLTDALDRGNVGELLDSGPRK